MDRTTRDIGFWILDAVERLKPKPKVSRNEYMREYMRRRAAAKRQQKAAAEALAKLQETSDG